MQIYKQSITADWLLLTGIILLALLPLALSAHTLRNEKTGSMGAEFDRMRYLQISHVPYEKVKVGQVICYEPLSRSKTTPGIWNTGITQARLPSFVCHRVIDEYYWGPKPPYKGGIRLLLAKGDTNKEIDQQYIDEWSYLGMVKWNN